MSGKLLIISAPSGSGKTTIVKKILSHFPEFEFSISACSRGRRPNEIHGKDYYFISKEEFKEKINNNKFLEWQEVYKDSFYGTLKSEVERIWSNNKLAVFDVDVVGGKNIKNLYPNESLALFIQPPSIEALEERLRIRGTETKESLKKRLDKAKSEMCFASYFDKIVVNDNLDNAVEITINLIKEFIRK